MNRLFVATLVVFFQICIASGQQTNIPCKCDSMDMTAFEPNLTGEIFYSFDQTIGSQYFYDWDNATITLWSDEVITHKKLRYNGYIDQMIWLKAGDFKQVKLDKSIIKQIYFEGLKVLFQPLTIKTNNDSLTIFAEVLYNNKLSLFANRQIKTVQTEVTSTARSTFTRNVIQNEPVYYLRLPGNQQLISFKRINRRVLLHAFVLNKPDIRKILRQNHLSVKNEHDLTIVMNYIEKALY